MHHILAALCLSAVLMAGCSPYNFLGEEELARLDDEELCTRRSNLVNGWLMSRELAARGTDCTPYDEAVLREGFQFSLLPPPPTEPSRAERPPPSLPPMPPPGAEAGPAGEPAPGGALPPGSPAPDALPPVAAPPVDEAPPAPPPRPATPPLVSSACAMRMVQEDGSDTAEARASRGWRVSFRNACEFPIRVLYAQRRNDRLDTVTELLRPGQASSPAPIDSGFRQPGYVVCSYETTPESAACRLP